MTDLKKLNLTYAQRRALLGVRDRNDIAWGVYGMSEHGGLSRTIDALRRKGLIEATDPEDRFPGRDGWKLTAAAHEALQ